MSPGCEGAGVWRRRAVAAVLAAVVAAATGAGLSLPALADEPLPASAAAASRVGRPRIGLVLSGGGARGLAHVGVLKELERQHVPIDAIAGTSMGAVVGGLYASGMSASRIESLMGSLDWVEAFRDRPSRTDLDFRRKEDDRDFLVHLPVGYGQGEFKVPKGLIQGQKLAARLREALLPVATLERFDQLPIPFRALATDLATGEPVVLDHGSLALALRASLSAPGVFAPVALDGRQLVDGGIAENLPVDVARSMGVDIVIAVDVSSPLQSTDRLKSALSISNQMISILIGRATARAKASLGPGDVYVRPDLGALSSLDFSRLSFAVAAGTAAVQGADGVAALGVDETSYAQYRARVEARPAAPVIDFVHVAADAGRYHKLIEAALQPTLGKPADGALIDESLRSLYGRDLFQTLDYQLASDGDRHGLNVNAQPKSWGPTFLRFALELQDDFRGNASFNAGVRAVFTDMNPYLAEWRVDAKVGDRPKFAAEFYQPLGYASPWFIAPSVRHESRNVPLFDAAGATIATYRITDNDYGVDLGRELGPWGEVRVGVHKIRGTSSLSVGSPELGESSPPPGSYAQGGYFARFTVDRLDSVNFPRHGNSFSLEWDAQRAGLGATEVGDRARADWLIADSRGRNTLVFWTTAGTALTTLTGAQSEYLLGGFMNLSGLPANSLAGPHFAIARLVYLRKISAGGEGLFELPAYLGLSAEAGNVWNERHDIRFSTARKDGSAFLGLDTLIGPAYAGAGYDEGGHLSYYLFLGRTF